MLLYLLVLCIFFSGLISGDEYDVIMDDPVIQEVCEYANDAIDQISWDFI